MALPTDTIAALGTPREPLRDTYYWYYATLVMSHMGGDRWQAWHDRLHPLIVNSQVRQGTYAGSWDPKGPIPDRWGLHAGRIYVTAMNLLSLEVQHGIDVRRRGRHEEQAQRPVLYLGVGG